MPRNTRVFGAVLLVILVTAAALLSRDPEGWGRRLYLGPGLLEVSAPEPGGWRPLGGVGVVVRFLSEERVVLETFRCFLNGRDVTDQLAVSARGAGGTVFPLLEGRNQLQVEVFGRGWWGARYYRQAVGVALEARGPLGMDRADAAPEPLLTALRTALAFAGSVS